MNDAAKIAKILAAHEAEERRQHELLARAVGFTFSDPYGALASIQKQLELQKAHRLYQSDSALLGPWGRR